MRLPAAAATTSLFLLLGGCAPGTAPAVPSRPTASNPPPSAAQTLPVPMTPSSVDPALAPFVEEAVADLARRLGAPREDIDVIEARAVVWPDGSLGCPQPGMMYPQVMVDGVLVRLSAGGRTFSYHGGGSRRLFLCENT